MNGFSALPRITLARLLPTPIPSLIWRKLTHLTEIDLNLICLNVHQGNWKLFGVPHFCSFLNKWVCEFLSQVLPPSICLPNQPFVCQSLRNLQHPKKHEYSQMGSKVTMTQKMFDSPCEFRTNITLEL